jgi:hypothetical protein
MTVSGKQFSNDDPLVYITRLREYLESGRDLYKRTGHWVGGVFVYDTAATDFAAEWQRRIKPLRNVVPRAVDFFALKMLPGDVTIVTDADPLKAAVEQVLKWSNFAEKKKLFITDLSLTGDLFLRVATMPNKAYFQYILPEDVYSMEEDYRGYLQNIRIEYEIEADNGVLLTHTEYWDKVYFSIWDHQQGRGIPLDQLGVPKDYGLLSAYGLDFCPIVHIKFKDIGRPDHRGIGCVTPSLPVIEEASRQASIMAKTAFRDKQTFVVSAASVDANGYNISQIQVIKHLDVLDSVPGESQQDVTPDDIWQAPAMSTITSLLAGINWTGLQELVDSTMEELNQEIPALRYWSIKEGANLATKTVALLLDAALSQAREASRSFVSGLVRACQIALTMGIYQGLFDASLGNYAAGDFDFDVTAGQAFEPSMDDKAITLGALKSAGLALPSAMKLAGFSQDEIDENNDLAEQEQANKLTALKTTLTNINSGV